jgi:hypothetical protein
MTRYLIIKDRIKSVDYKLVANEDAMQIEYSFNSRKPECPDYMIALPGTKKGLSNLVHSLQDRNNDNRMAYTFQIAERLKEDGGKHVLVRTLLRKKDDTLNMSLIAKKTKERREVSYALVRNDEAMNYGYNFGGKEFEKPDAQIELPGNRAGLANLIVTFLSKKFSVIVL